MGSTYVFVPVRVLHVLLAAVWLGSTVFTSLLLMPAVNDSGPAGGQIMVNLGKRGISAFFGAIGGLTAVTGIYLYWRFTGGFDPTISASRAGMLFGIGGVAGILAVILGGAVVGRSSNRIVELMGQVMNMPDGPQKTSLLQDVTTLKGRLSTWGSVVLLLQIVAAGLMALGHYV
jgi:hypothetical protein